MARRLLERAKQQFADGDLLAARRTLNDLKELGRRWKRVAAGLLEKLERRLAMQSALERLVGRSAMNPRAPAGEGYQAYKTFRLTPSAGTSLTAWDVDDIELESMEATTAGETTIARVPHIEPEHEWHRKRSFSARVYLDITGPRESEMVEEVRMSLPAGVTSVRINVTFAASGSFRVIGRRTGSVRVTRGKAVSSSVRFKVGVESGTRAKGGTLTAYFSFNIRPCGKVRLTLSGAGTKARKRRVGDPMILEAGAQRPDLVIEVLDPEQDGRRLRCRVSSRLRPRAAWVRWNLRENSSTLVSALLDPFVDPRATPSERAANLEGAGLELFRRSPESFKSAFWDFIDSNEALRSILIVSEEPSIPWELMIPVRRRADGSLDARKLPLGAEYAFGRWLPKNYTSPPQHIALTNSLIIAPDYPGSPATPQKLKHALEEAAFVRERFPERGPALKGDFESLGAIEGGASLIHIVCHGKAGRSSVQEVYLHGDNKTLSSTQLRALEGFRRCCSSRPLVFLNACNVGRVHPALNGVSGFAESFIDLNAAAVIAPLWSIRDGIAFDVAKAFYSELLRDPSRSFASILSDIRKRAFKDDREDTYVAYCFFGDPLASATGP